MEPNASPDVNAGTPAKHFLLSKTFWIALLGVIVVPWLKRLGFEFPDVQAQDAADAIVKLLTVAGVLWARAKATGPLEFGLGKSAVLLAFVAVALLLGGCSSLAGKVKLRYCRNIGGTQVCAETDGKSVNVTAGK
jgi:uncharacterized membrane protein